jgi:hypothetical protein
MRSASSEVAPEHEHQIVRPEAWTLVCSPLNEPFPVYGHMLYEIALEQE